MERIGVNMNRLLLLALLIFLATSNYAQILSPIEVTTKDGKTVILKPNGTWEFKKVVPQPLPIPVTSSVKQNIGVSWLPPNFSGHNVETLFNQLFDLKERLVKSEFETTTQYEKRVAEEMQKPILDNLTIKDNFTLVFPSEVSYNADLQKMRFYLSVRTISHFDKNHRKTASNLADVNPNYFPYLKPKIFFDGFNGVKLWEESKSLETEGTISRQIDDLLKISKREFNTDYFTAEISLSIEEAKRIKNTIRVAIIVQFEEPYALTYHNYEKKYEDEWQQQLQVRLIDVYFFDQQTGKILAKMSEVKK